MSDLHRHDGFDAPNGDGGWGSLQPRPVPPPPRHRSLFTRRLTWRSVLLVLAGVAAFRLWLVESVIVDGLSMASTLQPNEWVLVLKPLKPHRFSVVTFVDPREQVTVIKRVIGMPGDTVEIEPVGEGRRSLEGSRVIVNGVPLQEPYATSSLPVSYPRTTVPKDAYFVLGDNRDDSEDSRAYGAVKATSLRGRAVLVVYPFSHMRTIPDVAEPEPSAQIAAR